jgi:hypothetical protein
MRLVTHRSQLNSVGLLERECRESGTFRSEGRLPPREGNGVKLGSKKAKRSPF